MKNSKHGEEEDFEEEASGRLFFVAVHVGAGYHAAHDADAYCRSMRRACTAAASVLSRGSGRSVDAVAAAIKVLEDDEITNAGRGSNLTEDGVVECDASIMDGSTGAFGAVGAVPKIRNAIEAAELLAKQSLAGPSASGRIPAKFLVGDGARNWAVRRGLSVATSSAEADLWLVTKKSRRQWVKYTKILRTLPSITSTLESNVCGQEPSLQEKNAEQNAEEELDAESLVMDTVGAVCVDAEGNTAAGASSGGIAMKVKGRVGLAALFGCGCWATPKLPSSGSSVGCCLTGAGECIIRQLAARECSGCVHDSGSGPGPACENFLLSLMDKTGDFGGNNDAGVLLLQAHSSPQYSSGKEKLGTVELVAAFTSQTFGVGYYGSPMKVPKTKLLKRHQDNVSLFATHCTFPRGDLGR